MRNSINSKFFLNFLNRNICSRRSLNEIRVIKKVSQQDLNKFSELTGDCNPIHSSNISEEERFVHGAFLNALVAGVIGSKFPGPGSIVVSQNFKFPYKCRVNDDIEIVIKLLENRKIMKISYECKQNENVVFEGDAKIVKINVNNNVK